jgi:hypothetical protein
VEAKRNFFASDWLKPVFPTVCRRLVRVIAGNDELTSICIHLVVIAFLDGLVSNCPLLSAKSSRKSFNSASNIAWCIWRYYVQRTSYSSFSSARYATSDASVYIPGGRECNFTSFGLHSLLKHNDSRVQGNSKRSDTFSTSFKIRRLIPLGFRAAFICWPCSSHGRCICYQWNSLPCP